MKLLHTRLEVVKNQSSSNFNMHKNDLRVLLRCRFQFSRSGVESEALHFQQGPGWCWCCWSFISSVQFSRSVLSDSLRANGLQHARPAVHHQLPEFTQTHVHCVADAIQPSHSLSSPSPPTFNHSWIQGLFQWVSSLHQVAKVLQFQETSP